MSGFAAYDGQKSMYEVHKFMGLGKPEMDYFITQVGMAAASFGVAKDDITAVANALNMTFNMACSPPATVIKSQGDQLQAICIDQSSCLKAQNAKCDSYAAVVKPSNATSTMSMSMTGTMTGTMTGSMSATGSMMPTNSNGMPASSTSGAAPTATANAAAANGYGFAAAAAGLAAFLL
ncbi:hypothetical protein QQS21_002687 [Conoideocrella luteorostrata]|uniref:Uncharacterized protein n=1 Tax=Conoideocrella luteorostrata TaxID=1105319 RepID=A0AAJ0CXN2_9HYPO|nr:hypothetical protein QQS21_002687 [Conoideocrella luteorostrata]